MDVSRVSLLRDLLEGTGWVERSRSFAQTLRRSTRTPGGLLLVGTPDEEPWHLAAHLDDESRYSGVPELSPTLVRWAPPPGAPPHLAVTMARLEAAQRGETVFVVAPDAAPAGLLERVSDARRVGATVLAIDSGDEELESLAHEAIRVPGSSLLVPRGAAADLGLLTTSGAGAAASIEVVSHLVSAAAGADGGSATATRRGLRASLARIIDGISGPPPAR